MLLLPPLGLDPPPGVSADSPATVPPAAPTWGFRAAPFLMGQNHSEASKLLDDELGAELGPARYGILLDAWRALARGNGLVFAVGGFLGGHLHFQESTAMRGRSLHDETLYAGASGVLILRLGDATDLFAVTRLGFADGRLSWGGPAPFELGPLLAGELGFHFPRAYLDFGLGWMFAPASAGGAIPATYDRGGLYAFLGLHFGL